MPSKKTPPPSSQYSLWEKYNKIILIVVAIVILGKFLNSLTEGASLIRNIFFVVVLITIFRVYPDKLPGGLKHRIVNYKKHLMRLGLSIIAGILFLISIPSTITTYIATNAKSPSILISNSVGGDGNMLIGTGYEYEVRFSVVDAHDVKVNGDIVSPIEGAYVFTGRIKEGTMENTIVITASNKHKSSSKRILAIRHRNELEQAEYDALQEQKRLEAEAIQKEKELRLPNALKKLRSEYDDITDVITYEDKTSPVYINQNGLYLSLRQVGKTGTPHLRFHIQYAADNRLFIESYTIKVDDETFYIYEEEYGEIQRDNGYGGIWEWLTRSPSKEDIEMFRKISNAKVAKIRFEGDMYYKDKDITTQQKQALKNILEAYDAMLALGY